MDRFFSVDGSQDLNFMCYQSQGCLKEKFFVGSFIFF